MKRKMLVTLLCITVVLSSTTACGAKKDTTIAETKTATMATETVATIDTKISMKPSNTVMRDDVALTENATVMETKNMTVPTDRVDSTITKPITVDTMIDEPTAKTEPAVTQTETVTEAPTENVTMTETPVECTNETTSPADEEEMDRIDAVACEDEITGIITTDNPIPDPEYAPSNDTECAEETNAMNM